jgi:plasmid stability protein
MMLSHMAQLIVRNLNDRLVKRLKRRAAEHGVSMEEEHRRLLREVLEPRKAPKPKMSFKEYLLTMPNVGEDSDFEMPRNDKPREVDLSD